MSSRRWLLAVAALSAALHVVGMARTPLPAQDGLKFLRVARRFQAEPWAEVVRGADQHPLYPALVALAEPVTSLVLGRGSDAWRVAAQGVSMLAAVALLWPLHHLTRRLFDEPSANLAVFFHALLPFPAAIGHDTLSDALALGFTVAALCLGEVAIRTRSWGATLGCGAAAGLGFLTRPEVALVPPVVAIVAMFRWRSWRDELAMFARLVALSLVALAFIGSYALVKGQLSEKLSLRWATSIGVKPQKPRRPPPLLPRGLDDPRFDFSPKEISDEPSLKDEPSEAAARLGRDYAEGISYGPILVVLVGLVRGWRGGNPVAGRLMLLIYAAAFAAIAIRHASTLGYLSGRHALTLIVVSLPWAGAGTWAWSEGFPARRGLSTGQGRRLGYAGLSALAILGIAAQAKAGHPSRWGYRAAGTWLAGAARPGETVLDTRGWASFVRGVPGYDYWHVRQALGDRNLRYVVVGSDELKAKSGRAATLRAILAHAGKPVASFPNRKDGRGSGVEVFRFQAPESWEGIRP